MTLLRSAFTLLLVFFVVGCQEASPPTASDGVDQDGLATGDAGADFQIYKSPTCGCCGEWVEHIQHAGFSTAVHHPDDLGALKAEQGIAREYQSCHTAVSPSGFVFEGHIPARDIEQFLEAPPEGAIGLAVPGMPVGSPGMEVGDRFTPYDVLLLKADGSSEVFRHVASASEQ
ncbi:hypothetical protein FHR99_000018 [Litorivivens lipolytica]|uniref:Metal-binding protein n=1 Tax=Litorivivens lipolytica TaxID=1524264 RepID=A0A7W4Z488_9GAMM|nr:DUF411 domain-containing protein [Litorivivens lipolytica]MBB3045782.1 hypothetical protein [Litorivivens lipolytica]